jgi:xanthine dehydrogenase accessory factor
MFEIQNQISRWLVEGLDVAIAQVTNTWGSSPRVPGSIMAIAADGRIAGSVSGGCVEGSVIQAALDCLEAGRGHMEKFHASTPRAHEVGLSCGGSIDVLITKLSPALFAAECTELNADREYVRVTLAEESDSDEIGTSFLLLSYNNLDEDAKKKLTVIPVSDENSWHLLLPKAPAINNNLADTIVKVAIEISNYRKTELTGHVFCEGYDFFFSRVLPKPKLICVGGVHISIHLAQMAKMLGYRTVVIDPRGVFSTHERFPFVDELMHTWPQEALKKLVLDSSTALCALTHDPKIDVPALVAALESPAFYIGSLGRITTQYSRYRQLVEGGFDNQAIGRIFGPIGLDLYGREPAEIALAIMSEITMVRSGGDLPTRKMLDSVRRTKLIHN